MRVGWCRKETWRSGIIFLLQVFLAEMAVLFCGCVSGPDDVIVLPPADTYHTKVAEGWLEFEKERYDTAITAFKEAREIDPVLPEAYLGLGWCYAMFDQMDNSLSSFDDAIARNPESPDAYAAKAFVHLAQNEYELAIEAAREAIVLGGEEYVFGQLPDVQTRNLRLLMAESYYATGQYKEAQAQVDILKPDNNLDQDSYNYTQELILTIESLGSTVPVLDELTN